MVLNTCCFITETLNIWHSSVITQCYLFEVASLWLPSGGVAVCCDVLVSQTELLPVDIWCFHILGVAFLFMT